MPQQRKQKKWQAMLSELKNGDRIVTSGGLRGTIVSIKDDALVLRVPPDNLKLEHGLTDVVHREAVVEQADEGADAARGIVVLGLAEEKCAAALEVAQVHVVAERGAHSLALSVADDDDLGLGIVPVGIRADADEITPADRR